MLLLFFCSILLNPETEEGRARQRFIKNFNVLERKPNEMLDIMRQFMDSLKQFMDQKRAAEIIKVLEQAKPHLLRPDVQQSSSSSSSAAAADKLHSRLHSSASSLSTATEDWAAECQDRIRSDLDPLAGGTVTLRRPLRLQDASADVFDSTVSSASIIHPSSSASLLFTSSSSSQPPSTTHPLSPFASALPPLVTEEPAAAAASAETETESETVKTCDSGSDVVAGSSFVYASGCYPEALELIETSLQNTVVMPVFQRIIKALRTVADPRDKIIAAKVWTAAHSQ